MQKEVAHARLYVSGLGVGVYYLNGRRLGDEMLESAFTDYSNRVFYVTRDVTDLVREGRNALGAALGRGFYGMVGFNFAAHSRAPWQDEPELDGGFAVDVTVPPNATGVVRVPTDDPDEVAEVGRGVARPAERAPGVQLEGVRDGRVVYRIGSGTYRFRTRSAGPR